MPRVKIGSGVFELMKFLAMSRREPAVSRPVHIAAIAKLVGAALALAIPCAAHAQLRIMDYNIAQLRGNLSALQNVFTAAHNDDKPGFAVPVSIFVFEEVVSTQTGTILNAINATAPPGITYVMGTFTSSASEDSASGAQAVFFRSDMINELAASHLDLATGGGRNTDRWLLRLNGYNSALAWMYVYASHLKADMGSANETERLNGVTTIRNNSDALGVGLNILYCGDMNFYNNSEPGYLRFLQAGNGQAIDPLGSGSWAGSTSPPNNANNYKHTQSPLLTSVSGLTGGGMDDRFDFQLIDAALQDGMGLALIPGTYRAMGNDGQHYNQAIDNIINFYYPGDVPRSNALAMNLRLATDHVPVLADYQIPAMMAGAMPANYGRVIVNTPYSVTVNITNPAKVVAAIGADVLNYTATGSVGLSGVATGTVEPLGDVAMPSFALNTATPGVRNGTVTLASSSQAVQPSSLVLNTTGTVVRHANASFSNSADLDQTTVPLSFDANTGVQNFSVNVYNFGFDALQATLDIDAVTGAKSPFAYVDGATLNIGSTPATLNFSFDTTGLSAGTYNASITINTSDEDIPGETAASLDLMVAVTINGVPPTCVADIAPTGGDGMVNVSDLLAIINAWGSCPAPPANCPDTNNDGLVNVSDLLAIINAWGACP